LDTYQLKSLDGVLEASIREVSIVKDKKGKLMLKMAEGSEDDAEDDFDNFAIREPYDRIIRCLGFTFDTDIFNEYVEKSPFLSSTRQRDSLLLYMFERQISVNNYSQLENKFDIIICYFFM